ncbi:flagellar brake protein YcgR [Trabulsiella odontotermitis]|uniref:Flagellar brake protein YcgR n=1 Tax=Trabulsiella odontotermitis TaxID=379893 RepID=A0A0L0GIP1_9ENTR|nr:flagellar brake protein [Trabulsiella odontotermitis]KNC88852.1 flagellar brake protein [Trabulsiella odontotermitis]KNC91015.1 flagellar brake protein [Trabulsiella odontotermitis]
MSHYNEQFLKQSPLAVLNVLRDLHKDQVPLRVAWASGQFISRILAVTPEALIIDFGSQDQENLSAQRAENFLIDAETKGAKVEFTLPKLEAIDYLSLPAFTAPVPPSLWFVQRREFFRISAPLHPVYLCTARLPDNSEFRFRLCDLSLGGMGALLEGKLSAALQVGMQIPQLELDMGDWGKFHFDAQLIAITERKVVDSKNETISTPRLSFRFLNVNPAAERTLQRIIFALEREARERASKVL